MERLERALFRLEQGFELQFRLGPTLQGKDVQVYTNYPAKGHKFDRLMFHPLDWFYPNGWEDDCDKYCRLDLIVAGSYQYYFSCGDKEKVSGGYIVVDPVLKLGANNDILPLDCISSQKNVAKCLGPLDKWLDKLRFAKETGYNMVHFSPLQKLDVSGSCYPITDQLKLNPDFSPEGKHYTWGDIGNLVETLRKDWNMLCITDMVFNHTAVSSEWIHQHPECGYNLVNSPYLKPAWLLDRALWHLSCDIADEKYDKRGVPALFQDDRNMNALRGILWQEVFYRLRLWEFLQVSVDEAVEQFRQLLQAGRLGGKSTSSSDFKKQLTIVQDPQHRRFGNTVDMNSAFDIFRPHSMSRSDTQECCLCFRKGLEEMNLDLYKEMNDHVFHFPFKELTFDEEMQLMEQREKACHFLAHDGFVEGNDMPRNFAEPGSQVYLRRELVCQGDTIKLRYGEKPEDSPYLWAHMKTYTEITARVFSGLCLVNCLSTPLHVSEAMLSAARSIKPNLYVIADISTSSQHIDNVYVTRLGITSLVRDVGSSERQEDWGYQSWFGNEPVGAFSQPSHRPLIPAVTHTMLMDRSPNHHSPIQESSVYDFLPRSTLVSMACCATGSTREYDQLLHQQENQQYTCWNSEAHTSSQVNLQTGMLAVKLALNRLHHKLAAEGFSQVYVEQLDECVVAVTRHCPSSHQSVVAVLRRAIKNPETHYYTNDVPPMLIPGRIKEVVVEARAILNDSKLVKKADMVSKHNSVLQEVAFEKFTPGSIIIFRVTLEPRSHEKLGALRSHLSQFSPQYQTGSLAENSTPSILTKPLMIIMSKLTLADMNVLLYHCDAEEREDGRGCYHIPSWLPLNYGGLQGLMSVLAEIRPKNDLGHPLCDNLRQGDWMMDYVSNRLLAKEGALGEVGHWFQAMFGYLKHSPRYLVPCYFDSIIQGVYNTALEAVFKRMSSFVQNGSSLVKQLALGSVQMCGVDHSWAMPTISPHLKDVQSSFNEVTKEEQCFVSLAAGLPHFCAGVFRCWGRDTFISLRGLLLLTGRYLEARNIILAFAGTLHHGLIPNLLGSGTNVRYNCRDSVWWWLQCIQEYYTLAPDGVSILKCPVKRMYPNISEQKPYGAG
ncbi:Glycogen debranching enzyme, partial [Dissostichus eleginoides]